MISRRRCSSTSPPAAGTCTSITVPPTKSIEKLKPFTAMQTSDADDHRRPRTMTIKGMAFDEVDVGLGPEELHQIRSLSGFGP